MLATALASKTEFNFFNVSSSVLSSKWRGDSEKAISVLFALARHNAPSIVYLDEAESILGDRMVDGEHEASKRYMSKSECFLNNLHNRLTVAGASLNS